MNSTEFQVRHFVKGAFCSSAEQVMRFAKGSSLMKFIAIDFETANPCLSSVCQVGLVTFDENSQVHKWKTLINPEDYFDKMNISVHGIEQDHVKDAPRFPLIFEQLAEMLTGQVVVHHTGFDKIALGRATAKHKLPAIECSWLDTAKVVRMTWPQLQSRGYGLANAAKMLGIEFGHHDAEEDARVAGEILLRAIRHSGVSLTEWLSRVSSPMSSTSTGRPWRKFVQEDYRREGNPAGPLAGETVVFTGALQIPRCEAADLAAEAGCDVADSVTKATTLLVVGDQDIRVLAGHEKSGKHRKAEALMAKGHSLRIVGESDFQRLIAKNGE